MRPSNAALETLYTLADQCPRKIIIKDFDAFHVTQRRASILMEISRMAEHLEIRSPRPSLLNSLALGSYELPCCQTLILDWVVYRHPSVLVSLMECAALSLVTLSIRGIPNGLPPLRAPQWCLTSVKLVGTTTDTTFDLVRPSSIISPKGR